MDYSLTEIKDLIEIAKPVIDPIITTLIKPKIAKLGDWLKSRQLENKITENYFENKFEEYLARTYNYFTNINLLIFQNQQIKIEDIYIPLTIRSTKNHKDYKLDNFSIKILSTYKKILISDTAGMGKSTIMKWAGLQILENKIGIPILIELRNIKSDHNILDEIFLQINPIDKTFDQELILKFLSLGNFIILFDGFDEIQQRNQELIIKDLRDFINKTTNNYFMLTSRPEGALASFGDFQMFNINPLKKQESFELIRKYDSICPVKVGDKLINDIEKNFNQTQELLQNPFLVSLIYSTYTYNKDIPSTKVTFYEEIYSALFKRHDLSKDGWTRDKKSKLDIQQFKIITRQLAFDTGILGEVAYSESELLNYIKIAKNKCPGLDFNIIEYFDDLLSAVPLFQRDGSKIKWAHKSLQDYFAADFIAFDIRKEEILNRIYLSGREGLLNILDLFCELDFKTFRRVIVSKLLLEYITFYQSSYKNFQDILQKDTDIRKSLEFEKNFALVKIVKPDLSDAVKKANKLSQFDKNEIRAVMFADPDIVILHSYTFKRKIMDLITEKYPNYISKKGTFKSKKISLPDNNAHAINDDKSSILNNGANFTKINSIINYSSNLRNNGKTDIIDIQKVKMEYDKISAEIEQEKSFDNFKDI